MRKSRITSHSEHASVTPRRNQPRSSRSMGSPARSTASTRLSNVVDKFKEDHKDSFAVSPLSKTVLSDNTEIEMPRRRSWWRKVENSRDVIEVLENEKQANPANVLEEFDVEVLSQEKKDYTLDLPESSGSESIGSIVLPQRKLFTQKENVPQNKFGQVITNRESLGKHNKTNFNDNTVEIGQKNLFTQTSKRTKPVFPSALLNMSHDKTANKTKEAPTEVKGQPKSLFGNRLGTKRKNMFADFFVSESEDEIPDIQPKLFAFHKPSQPTRRSSTASRGFRDSSPTSSITTDIEMDDWKLLPSSTMVEHQLQTDLTTPGKRARLSKLSEAKESTKDTTKQSDQTISSKNKSNNLKRNSDFSMAKAIGDPDSASAHEEKTKEMSVRQPHASVIEENVQEKMELTPNEMVSNQDHFENGDHNQINIAEQDKAEASQEIEDEKRMDTEQELCPTTPEKNADTTKQSERKMSSKNKSDDQIRNMDISSQKMDENPDLVSVHREITVTQPHASVVEENVQEKNERNASDIITNQEHSEEHEPEEELRNDEIEDSEHNQINTAEQDRAEASQEMEAEERTDAEQELEDDDEKIEQENKDEDKEDENITDDEEKGTEEEEEVKDLVESNNEEEISQEIEQPSGDEQDEEQNEENMEHDESHNQETNGEDLQDDEQPTNDEEQEVVQVSKGDAEDEDENKEEQVQAQEDADNENDDKQEQIQAMESEAENESGDGQDSIKASAENAENDSDNEIDQEEIEVSNDENESENEENINELKYDEHIESHDQAHSDQEVEGNENKEINASDQEVDDENEEINASDQEVEDDEINASDQEVEGDENKEINASDQELEGDENKEINASDHNVESDENEQLNVSDQEIEGDENEEINSSDQEVEGDEYEEMNASDQEVEGDDNEEINSSDQEVEGDEYEEMNASDQELEDDENEEINSSDQEVEGDENKEINASEQEVEGDDNEEEVDMQEDAEQEPSEVTTQNVTHDTTGRNRKKRLTETPEAVLHEVSPAEEDSFTAKGRNTSIRKTKSILKNFSIRPSMAPPRESTGLSDGTKNSSAEGSGWDSHRTTRKTLRQTFGRDFTPRKSLRALVMEKSAKRQTMINEANAKLHQANSTELQDNQDFDMEVDENVDPMESDHEVSRRTRQTTLEMYLQKIKKENMERKQKIEQQVENSLKSNPVRVDVLNFRMPGRPSIRRMKPLQSAPKAKRLKPSFIPLEDLPSDLIEDMKYKPPKRFRPSNASWITKRLYKFLETKLEPKYDYKARIRAEKLVETIYNFVRDIRRLKVAPSHSVTELKREMARLDVVSTHFEFYNFFGDYLPSEIKIKVVPDIVNNIPLPREGVFAPILV